MTIVVSQTTTPTAVARILNLALKDAGVLGEGETAGAEMLQDAFDTFKQMIAQWQEDAQMVYIQPDETPLSFPDYASPADSTGMPAIYDAAMRYSLAEMLPSMFQVAPRPDIAASAKRARKAVKRMNLRIADLELPAELLPSRVTSGI